MLIQKGWWRVDWEAINTEDNLNSLVESLQTDLQTLMEANVAVTKYKPRFKVWWNSELNQAKRDSI